MDKSIYVAMTSTTENMLKQAVCANNLANASTPGFRAALVAERAMPTYGDGFPTRVFVGAETPGYNFRPGSIEYTGDPLNVAVTKNGWIAVHGTNDSDKEAYTKRGDLRVENGMLINGAGNIVLGEGGPISVPPAESIIIAEDGSVNIVPPGNRDVTVLLGKIKLVNPDPKNLAKREDGLFVTKDGALAAVDPTIRVKSGMIESSNVNAVEEMINLVMGSKNQELSCKLIESAKENDQASARLLQLS